LKPADKIMGDNVNSDFEPRRNGGGRTHFGYREVDENDKAGLVAGVFSSVASRYDIMNDLMSMGAHRLWKRFAASQSGLAKGDSVLDVAAGSGDLAHHFANQVGEDGSVVLTDINQEMLVQGKSRMIDAGNVRNVYYVIADAENLGFDQCLFDCVSISFGLRNVTHKSRALESMYRVLRPGGRILVLEFSSPVIPLIGKFYDSYSLNVIPKIGKLVANDENSYRYLVESIRRHPNQEALKKMMEDAGFEDVRYHNLSGGIVSLHIGFRYADQQGEP
jgi:demethylmenaquinone methyltransferase/2-methoxy-6-polyprenyl-1,4-benzoquinol methylase